MISFLQHIVNDIDPGELAGLKNQCFVFPTKRGGLHFQDLLIKKFSDQTFIAPRVLSIEEFIDLQCPELAMAEELTLLFKLYEEYKKEEPGLSFENFFVWGQTILRDFDEIDRYMLDGDKVYQNLHEIKELEASFGPNEEMIKAQEEFQKVIEVSQGADLYKKFLKNWLTVGRVRPKFTELLKKEGLGYPGMCYKLVAERMSSGDVSTGFDQVIFAGFNALSKSEELIFKSLLDQNLARIYFDADKYYLESESEEAGLFLRQLRKKWQQKNVHWVITDGYNEPKKIQILGSSQQVVQAREAGRIATDSDKNAIILGDESMLMPLLYALPSDQTLNITMGYPLNSTSVGGFLLAYMRYQSSIGGNRKDSNPFVDRSTSTSLLEQPLVQKAVSGAIKLPGKARWLPLKTILEVSENEKHSNILSRVFEIKTGAVEIIQQLESIILELFYLEENEEDDNIVFEEKLIGRTLQYLQNLRFMVETYQSGISPSTLERIIRETFKVQKVPFSGEPLVGTQIMGFLETRTLDFKKLIILSVNEGSLPSTSVGKSYLPFGLRKAFGLPTFVEQNSIYAYHFFRLLQRASDITLIYNSQLAFDGSGEKSRFILQLIDRLKSRNNILIDQSQIITPIGSSISEEHIEIAKTGLVLDQLNGHYGRLNEKYLSPTALVQYLECSLKYYFSKIQGITSQDDQSEDIDAREFGNILHHIMEEAYTPFIGKEVSFEDIQKIRASVLPDLIEKAFESYGSEGKETGDISFTKHVVHHLADKILTNDSLDAPLFIKDLESLHNPLKYTLALNDGRAVNLSGKVDRLDAIKVDGENWLYRILDYKTGKFELGKAKNRSKPLPIDMYVDQYFNDPKFKSGFQTYFYALLYSKINPEDQITGGIIGGKNLNDGVAYLRSAKHTIDPNILDLFEERLRHTVEEIFDTDVPFTQTDDLDRCRYCDFKNICRR